ncbi:hypothetical protein [Paenarthrobacter sp. NPDC057981]|uniref:hypothetical protein n=1 Tax=Paenarthrobacter sp. NPDC057981 TaxID=3346297 RepID=UPI0036DCB7E7
MTSNKEIAGAWLHGHLLHEDDVRRSYAQGIAAEEMLLNATKTVCSEMLATVEGLHLIERLVVSGGQAPQRSGRLPSGCEVGTCCLPVPT